MPYNDPYDQRRADPAGWHFSMAVICGLVAIGALMSGQGAIAIAAAVGAVVFYRRSRA